MGASSQFALCVAAGLFGVAMGGLIFRAAAPSGAEKAAQGASAPIWFNLTRLEWAIAGLFVGWLAYAVVFQAAPAPGAAAQGAPGDAWPAERPSPFDLSSIRAEAP